MESGHNPDIVNPRGFRFHWHCNSSPARHWSPDDKILPTLFPGPERQNPVCVFEAGFESAPSVAANSETGRLPIFRRDLGHFDRQSDLPAALISALWLGETFARRVGGNQLQSTEISQFDAEEKIVSLSTSTSQSRPLFILEKIIPSAAFTPCGTTAICRPGLLQWFAISTDLIRVGLAPAPKPAANSHRFKSLHSIVTASSPRVKPATAVFSVAMACLPEFQN
jgi:hypothetical protein